MFKLLGMNARLLRRLMACAVSLLLGNALAADAIAQSEGIQPVLVGPAEVSPLGPIDHAPGPSYSGLPQGSDPQNLTIDQIPSPWHFWPLAGDPSQDGEQTCPWFSGLNVGTRAWISWGESSQNFRNGPINVQSELKWHNLVGESGEVSLGALLFKRVVASVNFGGGNIGGGHLVDDDYTLPNRQGLGSQSVSPAPNDNLRYVTADLGWRFCEGPNFFFDGLIGYQYWREHYIAEGGTQTVSTGAFPTPPAFTTFPPGPFVSEQFTWQALRVGGQGLVQLSSCCALKSQVIVLPVTHFDLEDIHYQRQFASNAAATGGVGVVADFRLTYWLWKGLYVEAGYRLWYAQSGSGNLTTVFANPSDITHLPFNQATTLRQGLILGLSYQF
jgi:hypothetical protein